MLGLRLAKTTRRSPFANFGIPATVTATPSNSPPRKSNASKTLVVPKMGSQTRKVTRVPTRVASRVGHTKGRTSTTSPTKITSACMMSSFNVSDRYDVAPAELPKQNATRATHNGSLSKETSLPKDSLWSGPPQPIRFGVGSIGDPADVLFRHMRWPDYVQQLNMLRN